VTWTFRTISWVMVGLVLLGYLSLVGLVWFVVCYKWKPVGIVPIFGYRGETCELWSFLATWLKLRSLWPLVTMGNLGALSCFDTA
jgi:hypothetical protein